MIVWITIMAVISTLPTCYTRRCGGLFSYQTSTASSGRIDSSAYLPALDCLWTVIVEPNFAVELRLQDLHMAQSPNCSTDYLEALDGLKPDSKVLMRVCGSRPLHENSTVTSTGNIMRVRLKSSLSDHNNTFRASYATVCGAKITVSDTGDNEIRYNPLNDPPNCTWLLEAYDARQHVVIYSLQVHGALRKFQNLSDEPYIRLWGLDSTRSTVGERRLSARTVSFQRLEPLISRGAWMGVGFVTFDQPLGLSVKYYVSNYSCGQDLRLYPDVYAGLLSSTDYMPADDCVWTVLARKGYFVKFTLLDLHIDPHSTSCLTDYLEVVDGPNLNGRVLMQSCQWPGNASTVTSTSSRMTVRLKSSSSYHNRFRATYSLVCGAVMEVSRGGVIQHDSVSFPNCSWTLVAKNARQHIYISQFTFDSDRAHEGKAYLDVWEGLDSTGQYRGRRNTSSQRGYVISRGTALHLKYVSFHKMDHIQFYYSTASFLCGAVLNYGNGHLDSSDYDLADDCVWTIAVPENVLVSFTLLDLNIASSLNCSTDYLEVVDGPSLDGKVLMRWCGGPLPINATTVTSTTSRMNVHFKASSAFHNSTFRAAHATVCGAVIVVSSGVYELHGSEQGFKNGYGTGLIPENCSWTLKAKDSNQRIVLNDFRVETSAQCRSAEDSIQEPDCNVTFVDVWEGLDSDGHHIGRFYGGSGPSGPLISAGPAVVISQVSLPGGKPGDFRTAYSVVTIGTNSENPSDHSQQIGVILGCISAGSALAIAVCVCRRMRRKEEYRHLLFEKGDVKNLAPERSISEQAEYLPYDKIFEIDQTRLRMGKIIGQGAFGVVRKAEAQNVVPDETVTTVAVKMVRPHRKDSTAVKALISELKILVHLGKHLNVVNLLGANTKDLNNILVIVEYCKHGNLHSYLLKHRYDFVNEINNETDCIEPSQDPSNRAQPGCCTSELLQYAFQVARGMEFLASRKVVHGDLAARNVLLADNNIVKICDFGLSKIAKEYQSTNRSKEPTLLPIKWMAIESIRGGKFTRESDVWSYGVFLWELFSLAETPHDEVPVNHLLHKLIEGYRLGKPSFATENIYTAMKDCWQEQPNLRPSFTLLAQTLGSMLNEADRQAFIDKNKTYADMNKSRQNESDYYDYLQIFSSSSGYTLLRRPTYVNICPLGEAHSQGTSHLHDVRLQDLQFSLGSSP